MLTVIPQSKEEEKGVIPEGFQKAVAQVGVAPQGPNSKRGDATATHGVLFHVLCRIHISLYDLALPGRLP